MTRKIRRARGADGAAIATTYLMSTAKLGFLRRVHNAPDMWHHFTTLGTRQEVWVAHQGQQVIGFLALKPGWIEHLYIHPRHQGKGAGTSLLSLAKTICNGDLRLWTFQQNRQAISFYKGHGLICEKRTDGRRNEEKLPDLLYVWRNQVNQ